MKIRKLLLPMALLAAFNAYGYDFENGNVYYDILSVEDHTCEVVSFGLEYANSYSGEVVIPVFENGPTPLSLYDKSRPT